MGVEIEKEKKKDANINKKGDKYDQNSGDDSDESISTVASSSSSSSSKLINQQ